MKKIIAFLFLCFVAAGTFAQDNPVRKSNYPYWTISKDVQRMQYSNVEYTPATIVTGNSTTHLSKGISLASVRRSSEATGTIKMTGMPSSVISKGVARMQYEKSLGK